MTGIVASSWTMSMDDLRAVTARAGTGDLVNVLALHRGNRGATRPEVDGDSGPFGSRARGPITVGPVEPDLEAVLHVLSRPDHELAMRLVTPEGTARISVARRDGHGVSARRIGASITLRSIGSSLSAEDAASAVLGELPTAAPAAIEPVTAPLLELAACLKGPNDARHLADRIRSLGTSPRSAMSLGAALSSRQAFAEIVYNAWSLTEDRISRHSAAVAVFYTGRGRIIASPSVSPARELWTTLKSGSDQAVGQAIGQLIGLFNGSWGTSSGTAV